MELEQIAELVERIDYLAGVQEDIKSRLDKIEFGLDRTAIELNRKADKSLIFD